MILFRANSWCGPRDHFWGDLWDQMDAGDKIQTKFRCVEGKQLSIDYYSKHSSLARIITMEVVVILVVCSPSLRIL